MNENIRAREVRLVGADGKQVGVVNLKEAQEKAQVAGLDLVQVSSEGRLPICKILDYGKYQYAQAKKEKEKKKKQKKMDIKGIRIGFKTDEHDQNLKKKRAEQFLDKGYKVRIEVFLRGREKAHRELAKENLREFMKTIESPYQIEEEISKSPQGLSVTIKPKK